MEVVWERTAPFWTADQASGPCWCAADRPLSGKRSEPLGLGLGMNHKLARDSDMIVEGPEAYLPTFRNENGRSSERLNISLPLLSRRARQPSKLLGRDRDEPQPMRHKRPQGSKERSVQISASQD